MYIFSLIYEKEMYKLRLKKQLIIIWSRRKNKLNIFYITVDNPEGAF